MSQPKSPRQIREEAEQAKSKAQSNVQKTVNSNSKANGFEQLKAANNGDLESVERTFEEKFLQFEQGVVYDLYISGLETRSIKGDDATVAVMEDASGNKYITGASVLVSALKEIENDLPDYFRITCTGKDRSEQGEYFTFSILRFKRS